MHTRFFHVVRRASPQTKPWVTNRARISSLTPPIDSIHTMTLATKDLADWGDMPMRPGLYLSLTHGRDFPQQTMHGRGFVGPKLGPLLYVRTHYGQEVTLRFANRRDAKRFFPASTDSLQTLQILEGTLVLGEKCFGDRDVCYIAEEFCAAAAASRSARQ